MGCLVFMFFYVLLVVPETKGLTLEEVNTMWEEGVLLMDIVFLKMGSIISRRGANYDAEEMAHSVLYVSLSYCTL
ncbi:CMF_collapsed_G0012990.mRNA.1.CDS.1 [Saccharomyces cerevisiae]|nr:CMF_collapsed_G0012990.mRNA.1.CDS.1 [Saccharomyces cerevisiae]